MSTKKIDHTIIEGGRIPGYKYERKQSLRNHRKKINSLLRSFDFEQLEDISFPEREKSSYYPIEKFRDKLSPVMRWLSSKVGKPWDEVYSEIRTRFDIRTTPGRHVVFDHILSQVWQSQDKSAEFQSEYRRHYVDSDGIIQDNPKYRYRFSYSEEYLKIREERQNLGDWLQGRLLGKVGQVLFWFKPNGTIPNPVYLDIEFGLKFYYNRKFDERKRPYGTPFYASYHQAERLSGKDVEFFSRLHPKNKNWLLEHSPQFYDYRGPGYALRYPERF